MRDNQVTGNRSFALFHFRQIQENPYSITAHCSENRKVPILEMFISRVDGTM